MAGSKANRKKKLGTGNSWKSSQTVVSPVESPSPLREPTKVPDSTTEAAPKMAISSLVTSSSDGTAQAPVIPVKQAVLASQGDPDIPDGVSTEPTKAIANLKSNVLANINDAGASSMNAVAKKLPLFDIHSTESSNSHTIEPLATPRIDDYYSSSSSTPTSGPRLTLGSPFRISADREPVQPPSNILSQFEAENITFDEDIDLDELEDLDETEVVSAIPVTLASKEPSLAGKLELAHENLDPELPIPQRSMARSIKPESMDLLQARRQTLGVAKPIMVESPTANEFDPDQYFSGSDDEIVTMDPEITPKSSPNCRKDLGCVKSSPCRVSLMSASQKKLDVGFQDLEPIEDPKWKFDAKDEASIHDETAKIVMPISSSESIQATEGSNHESRDPSPQTASPSTVVSSAVTSSVESIPKRTIRKVETMPVLQSTSLESIADHHEAKTANGLASPLVSPQRFTGRTLSASPQKSLSSPPKLSQQLLQYEADSMQDSPSKQDRSPRKSWLNFGNSTKLAPPKSRRMSLASNQSSPRVYRYAQSPLPTELNPSFKPEPPVFGVGVVGFHHKRGPEIEYWVGPEGSSSDMWPYLPFQSLPDGSHQFEENISYFTLLYDRNKAISTSLTFSRDEEGHIQAGTSDFRNVTTLFGIACSRQVKLSDLDSSQHDNSEYTRSVVQKSVFVIASKPIFGPIKEKLTVVTRSYFEQRDFSDRKIIDNFYDNLVQMPLWINESDLQVGMNLQRFVHEFGDQVLVLLKAALLECKILFYANDTDILGTTQFALISLIPNLINHLQDSGSPLLSSYEITLQSPVHFKTSDRQSVLQYCGFPLQIFAGGGVFSPFIPLQQFEDLRQPETRYGMMGTTNNLFLSSDIDFNVVVNIETNKVEIRDSQLTSLLKLTEADRAFMQKICADVKQAWDIEDRWHPQALGYSGGEDYIRHEIEEYLLALVASVKNSAVRTRQEASKTFSKNNALTGQQDETTSINSNSSSLSHASLAAWNKEWVNSWAQTNNFRIFDRHTDSSIPDLVSTEHPGIKLIKPSGMDRLWGFFRRSQTSSTNSSENLTTLTKPTRSTTSSVLNTPSIINSSEERFEPSTPI